MSGRIHKTRTGYDLRLWPVLLLLLVVVLAPTVCLLWFMARAIENEQLAMRQTLEQAYRRDLSALQIRLESFWQRRVLDLEDAARDEPAACVFAQAVRSQKADAVVCYDDEGKVAYPNTPDSPPDLRESRPTAWDEAWRLEFSENDPVAAAAAYAAIAQQATQAGEETLAARALQAQARCLVQAGHREQAIELITGTLSNPKYRMAVDPQGRLIAPNTQLMALQLMGGRQHPAFTPTATQLQQRLDDYLDTALAATQRRFLLQELKDLLPVEFELPMLPAEELAARFVETHPVPRQDPALHPSQLPDVWQMAAPGHRVVALFRTKTVLEQSERVLSRAGWLDEATVQLLPPEAKPAATDVLFSLPAGKYQPGWYLRLSLTDGNLAQATAQGRIAIYLWTGVLVILGMGILAGLIAQVFRRQLQVARLKNDLVATVSHELKTPLSSIRLLVDTLLDEQPPDPVKTREYLQLVAKENMRLSRLIDNFLAFSRMERNKQAFRFVETPPAAVVHTAVDAMRERLEPPGCQFELQLPEDLPSIAGDADALATALLNLLDNACKYTGGQKQITLRAYREDNSVCLAVSDNGIGLTRIAAKKVFQRFYQVDRRLARSAGGCGLGLSIVKYIVDAHGGSVDVTSRPGQGSRFTIRLPVAERKKCDS